MGTCCCKEKDDEIDQQQSLSEAGEEIVHTVPAVSIRPDFFYGRPEKCPDSDTVDRLVIETLGVIGTLVDK